MREETIAGLPYRAGKLSAKQQWNVVRRLAPVLASAGPAVAAWASLPAPVVPATTDVTGAEMMTLSAPQPIDLDGLFAAVGPLATALGELTDEASDYVLGACLAVCQTNRAGQTWAAVATRGGDLMFSDISMATMLRLTLMVLEESLSDFLGELRGPSPAPPV